MLLFKLAHGYTRVVLNRQLLNERLTHLRLLDDESLASEEPHERRCCDTNVSGQRPNTFAFAVASNQLFDACPRQSLAQGSSSSPRCLDRP